MTKEYLTALTYNIIGACMEVHKADAIVLELKSVKEIIPVHEAQLLTYMKLLQRPKGILVNFNCTNLFKEGQKTYVNEFYRNLTE